MFRRRLECDLWNRLSNSASTNQVNTEIKIFYDQYKKIQQTSQKKPHGGHCANFFRQRKY